MERNHIEIMNQPLNELFRLLTCETHYMNLFFGCVLLYGLNFLNNNKSGWISLKELSFLSADHSPIISLTHQP